MKKTVVLALVLGLIAASLSAPAVAGKKKKKKKPVETTLHLHGNAPLGDMAEFAVFAAEGTKMVMDATDPSDPAPKSFSYSFPAGNAECTGNPLFPSWEGSGITGKIVGDVKLIGHFLSPGTTATARLWVDVPFSSCTSSNTGATAFVEPTSSVDVEVPAGHNEVEIVFENVNIPITFNMIVELHQTSPAEPGRILYDSPDFDSRVVFSCVPAKGKSCTS